MNEKIRDVLKCFIALLGLAVPGARFLFIASPEGSGQKATMLTNLAPAALENTLKEILEKNKKPTIVGILK